MRKNIDPSVWGAAGWVFLRNCLLACDDRSGAVYVQWLHLLPEVLPCGSCRAHARAYLSQHPPENHKDLVAWLDAFRRAVSERVRAKSKRSTSSSVGWAYYSAGLLAMAILCTCLFFVVFAQR